MPNPNSKMKPWHVGFQTNGVRILAHCQTCARTPLEPWEEATFRNIKSACKEHVREPCGWISLEHKMTHYSDLPWGNPKGPLFKGASFKDTGRSPAHCHSHLQVTCLVASALANGICNYWALFGSGLTFQGRGGGEWPPHWAIHFPVEPHWAIHFSVEKSALGKKPL